MIIPLHEAGVKKQSLLDHVYVHNLSSVKKIDHESPKFGDHVLIVVELDFSENN